MILSCDFKKIESFDFDSEMILSCAFKQFESFDSDLKKDIILKSTALFETRVFIHMRFHK